MSAEADCAAAEVPRWRPYDTETLAGTRAPQAAIATLATRGLPQNADEHFVRVPRRELELAEIPEIGPVAFLGQVEDGHNNTYWLSLADGSVWMRYGREDRPAHHVNRIDESVSALQDVLEAWCEAQYAGISVDDDPEAYEQLIERSVLRAVRADPGAVTDPENWWSRTFEELEYTGPRVLRGERCLYEYACRDSSGA
jgi:hypothetical protein